MGTKDEATLQIKKFGGVDRFVEGTAQEPNVFETIQNMDIPNPGEIRAVNGTTLLNASTLAGVDSIKHMKFLDQGDVERVLVAMYKSNVASIPAPSGQTYSTSGGTPNSLNVYLMYVGPGNSYSKSTPVSQSVQANGLTVTLPTNIPDYIFCCHVFMTDPSNNYFWCGSFTKRGSVWPASITCPAPTAEMASGAPIATEATPAKISYGFGNLGNLTANREYFFGIAPWVPGKDLDVSYATADGKYMSVFLPAGFNSISIAFDFMPLNAINTTSSPAGSDNPYTKAVLFLGPTVEDGVPVCTSIDGGIVPVAVANTSAAYAQAGVDPTNNTITINGNIPEFAYLKIHSGGTVPAGLANDTYYYVRDPIYSVSTNKTTVSLSATINGTVVDITDTGSAGGGTFAWSNVTITVKELPYNSDLWSMCDSYDINSLQRQGIAEEGRTNGVISLAIPSTPASQDPKGLGCMAFTSLPITPQNRREILSNANQLGFNVLDHGQTTNIPSEFFVSLAQPIQSRQYSGRIWMTNAYNTPFYTNGYVLKVATVDAPVTGTPVYIPITDFLEFFQDRLILAGRIGNPVYSQGFFYYSAQGVPTNFGDSADTLQAVAVRSGDESEVRLLNIYSQDLTTTGPQTFLVVGKAQSAFTWNGQTTQGSQQIDRCPGVAGPNAFTSTPFGPVLVGVDNVYLLQNASAVTQIGDPIQDIIRALSQTQQYAIQCIYHDELVKIGYQDTSDLDREIRLRFRSTDRGTQRFWTGPHVLTAYTGQSTIPQFGDDKNYRASFLGAQIFRRDDPGSYLDNGVPIPRKVKIRNLGLQQDHFLKMITQIYLALRVVQDETFTFTLESQDGSQSIVVQKDIDVILDAMATGNLRQMLQTQVPHRFLARVLTLSVENTSDGDISIYDFSILYEATKRRLLP